MYILLTFAPAYRNTESQSVQGIHNLFYNWTQGVSSFVLFVYIRQTLASTKDCGNRLSSASHLVQQGQWETCHVSIITKTLYSDKFTQDCQVM